MNNKINFGLLSQLPLDVLYQVGIAIQPFYLLCNNKLKKPILKSKTESSKLTYEFLTTQHIGEILKFPTVRNVQSVYTLRLSSGKLCYGAFSDKELVAFMWVDPSQCNLKGYEFELKEHEAYIFDVRTKINYRGRGIGTLLNIKLHNILKVQGINTIYSICGRNNHSSLIVHKKLNYRIQESGIRILIGQQLLYSTCLKKFNPSKSIKI